MNFTIYRKKSQEQLQGWSLLIKVKNKLKFDLNVVS